MPHFVDELKAEADSAMVAMREASRKARHIHARAELMRHMLLTANKVKQQPRARAIDAVVTEWMNAWHLTRADWPELAREMDAFTGAFYDYANASTDASDAALRAACTALDAALAQQGTTISDQMAWRSQCAHGWWEMIAPTPRDLPGRKDRPGVPTFAPGAPFWDVGCADMCK
jgi:hypothetical protein